MEFLFSAHDHLMMEEALREAERAFRRGEVPVGAVLTFKKKIISRAHNEVEESSDPTAHAEILSIQRGAACLGNWRLIDATLYTTLEPCAMCAGAMLLSRLGRVVWGARDTRHGAHGSWVDLFKERHPTHQLIIEGGLCKERASELMRSFFRQRRRSKDEKKAAHFGGSL